MWAPNQVGSRYMCESFNAWMPCEPYKKTQKTIRDVVLNNGDVWIPFPLSGKSVFFAECVVKQREGVLSRVFEEGADKVLGVAWYAGRSSTGKKTNINQNMHAFIIAQARFKSNK